MFLIHAVESAWIRIGSTPTPRRIGLGRVTLRSELAIRSKRPPLVSGHMFYKSTAELTCHSSGKINPERRYLMKRFFWFSMSLIVLLAACSSSPDAECKEGICVSVEVEEPIQALQLIPFVIYFSTEKDISGLEISIYGDMTITIHDIEKKPDEAKTAFQKDNSIHWQLDTKGKMEYVIAGHIILAKPTVSYGIFSYGFIAAAGHPSITRVTDSITIYLDAEGKQVEENRASVEIETGFPLPTLPPDWTIVPETPMPTIIWPTNTPLPSSTPSPSPSPKITRTSTPQAYP